MSYLGTDDSEDKPVTRSYLGSLLAVIGIVAFLVIAYLGSKLWERRQFRRQRRLEIQKAEK